MVQMTIDLHFVDEKNGHEHAECDRLQLALDVVGIRWFGAGEEDAADNARGERPEQHIEAQGDAQADQRRDPERGQVLEQDVVRAGGLEVREVAGAGHVDDAASITPSPPCG